MFAGVVGSAGSAYAQITQVNFCTLRADITNDDLKILTPTQGGDGYNAGTSLGETDTPPSGASSSYVKNRAWGLLCAFATIKSIANIIFLVVIALSIGVIVYAGFLFLRSGGDPTIVKEARQWLLYGVIGIIVAIFSTAIPGIAMTLLGLGPV